MPANRPPRPFDPAVGAQIVARIEAGEPLRDLWRDKTLPGRFTLKRWRREVPAFSQAVRAAVNRARSRAYAGKWYGAAHRRAVIAGAEGGLTLKEIAALPGMPCQWAIKHWLNTEPNFRRDYAIAREMDADGRFEAAQAMRTRATTEEAARQVHPRLASLLDRRRLPRKHNLYQIWIDETVARTGLCPCRECRVERYEAKQRAKWAEKGTETA